MNCPNIMQPNFQQLLKHKVGLGWGTLKLDYSGYQPFTVILYCSAMYFLIMVDVERVY